jgi:hypothetical protein
MANSLFERMAPWSVDGVPGCRCRGCILKCKICRIGLSKAGCGPLGLIGLQQHRLASGFSAARSSAPPLPAEAALRLLKNFVRIPGGSPSHFRCRRHRTANMLSRKTTELSLWFLSCNVVFAMKRLLSRAGEFQGILERKEAQLVRVLRTRNGIAIEKSADQTEEIQYASERDLAISTVDRKSPLLRQMKTTLIPWAPRCIQCQETADRKGRRARKVSTVLHKCLSGWKDKTHLHEIAD